MNELIPPAYFVQTNFILFSASTVFPIIHANDKQSFRIYTV